MLFKILLGKLGSHASSVTLLLAMGAMYVLDEQSWLEPFLPINGKPLVVFMLVAIVVLYEMYTFGYKNINKRLDGLSTQLEVSSLKQAVNGLYNRFASSNDEYIDNEYTIIELGELKDMRERLGVNSYTQDRLQFLCGKIKRL